MHPCRCAASGETWDSHMFDVSNPADPFSPGLLRGPPMSVSSASGSPSPGRRDHLAVCGGGPDSHGGAHPCRRILLTTIDPDLTVRSDHNNIPGPRLGAHTVQRDFEIPLQD